MSNQLSVRKDGVPPLKPLSAQVLRFWHQPYVPDTALTQNAGILRLGLALRTRSLLGLGGFFTPAFARCCFCIAASLLVFTSPIRHPPYLSAVDYATSHSPRHLRRALKSAEGAQRAEWTCPHDASASDTKTTSQHQLSRTHLTHPLQLQRETKESRPPSSVTSVSYCQRRSPRKTRRSTPLSLEQS